MFKIIIGFLLVLFFFPVNSYAEERTTLYDSLEAAYKNNYTIRVARRELTVINERRSQAMSGWLPTVDLELGINKADLEGSAFGGSADGSIEKKGVISFEQPVFRGGRTVASVRSSENRIKAQENILLNIEQDILLQSVTAHMNVVRDEALVNLSNKNKEIIKEQLRAARDRFEVGEVTITDVSQAEARLAGVEADFVRAIGDLDISKSIYRQIIGVSVISLADNNKAYNYSEGLDNAIEVAINFSPRILSAKFLKDSDENEIDNVFGELLPDVRLSASYTKQYDPQPGIIDNSTDKIIGLSARIPLYQAGFVRSKLREAKELVKKRKVEILEIEEDVKRQVISNWRNYQSAKAEIISRKKQVEAAKIARDGVYAEEQAGDRTVLDILDADKELLDAEVNLVIANRDEVVFSYSLASSMGILIKNIK